MNQHQELQLQKFLSTVRLVRGFEPHYVIRESPEDIEFTSGVKPVDGAVYLWIAAAPDGSHGEFPPIAFSPREGAVSMPSIRTYVREQLLPSNGLRDVGGSEGFACAVFADRYIQKQRSGERWSRR
jgi:hypothetical protein